MRMERWLIGKSDVAFWTFIPYNDKVAKKWFNIRGNILFMRNIKALCIITISIIFLIVYIQFDNIYAYFSAGILSVEVVSEAKATSLTEGKGIAVKVEQIKYEEHKVAYDSASNTLYVPQNIQAKNWEGKLSCKNGQLYFCDDSLLKSKQEAIRDNHTFKLYWMDDEQYFEFNVVFTGMPVMCLSVESISGEGQQVEKEGKMRIFDPYHSSNLYQSAESSFHVRGGSSSMYEKSSYKLTLTANKLSLLGMRKDDDWILNALYDDAGLIHNKLSYQVWDEFEEYGNLVKDNSTTMEYVELFIEDEYLGVYGLTERIDQKELSLDKNDILYKCRADRIPEEHNYSNEITDEMRPIFVLKYPKDPTDTDWEPLKKWVNYFCKEQFSTYDEGAQILNMQNAIDYNLYCMLICGVDNIRKNIFLVAEYQSDGTYQYKKVPWDTNATWGNIWVEDERCNYTIYDPEYIEDVGTWCTDISTLYYYDEEKVSEMLMVRWQELRDSKVVTKEKIYEMLDEQFEYLKSTGAYERNYQRWPHGAEYFDESYIYEYVDGRIDFLDNYYQALYLDSTAEAIYNEIDYSSEFNMRTYWEKNKETLQEICIYDKQQLLEHYVLYGKPFGLEAKKQFIAR